MAQAYLGLFVWLAFLDELWCFTSGTGVPRLGEWILEVLLTVSVGTGLLYVGLALWGRRTGVSGQGLAEQTFGGRGARVLTGIGLGIAHLSIHALAIGFAVETTLLGFVACGLIAHQDLAPVAIGPILTRPPVFLTTAAFWVFITSTAEGLGLAGVIAALMRVYAPTALVVITAIGGWLAFQGSPHLEGEMAPLTTSADGSFARMMYGLLAVAAIAAPAWGKRAKSHRDVLIGAAIGIAIPAAWVAIVALFAVLPSANQIPFTRPGFPPAASFRFVIMRELNPWVASAALLSLGLAAVAPAYFACHEYTQRIWDQGSPTKRKLTIWGGAGVAFLMVLPRPWLSLADVAGLMGDLVSPLIGAMLATSLDGRADPPDRTPAVKAPGVVAWLVGSFVGLALDGFGRVFPFHRWIGEGAFPPAFYALLAAFLVQRALSRPSRLGKPGPNRHN